MKKMYVAIVCDGKLNIHMAHQNGNYMTLCGMDGDDSESYVNQRTVMVPKNAKIDCPDCRDIWTTCQMYKAGDFEGGQL